jgi:hypothetical protein
MVLLFGVENLDDVRQHGEVYTGGVAVPGRKFNLALDIPGPDLI